MIYMVGHSINGLQKCLNICLGYAAEYEFFYCNMTMGALFPK